MRLFTTPREDETREEFAARLVDESRAGVHASMATITNLRTNARRGLPEAVATLEAIRSYIAAHPVPPKRAS